MLAFLQYLIALIISTYALAAPGAPRAEPALFEIGLMLVAFGLGWHVAGRIAAQRSSAAGESADSAVRRHLGLVHTGRVMALLVFWLVMQRFDGRELPALLGVDGLWLVPHLIRLGLYALLVGLLRAGLHASGRAARIESDSLTSTLMNEWRSAVLPLAPILPLLLMWDVFRTSDPDSAIRAFQELVFGLPVLQAAVLLGGVGLALMVLPFGLKLMWRAHPLPPGDLRDRLEAYAERVGLRARDILVWPTGGEQMNAAVVGAFPRFRYVFITDGLLEALSPDEVEAVFAHEAGHARRGHILLFFGFTAVLVLSNMLPAAIGQGFDALFAGVDPLLRTLITVFVWFGVVFGFISRRFEQEADVFGLETIEFEPEEDGATRDPADHPFARALERIAGEVGGIREITGWRHFSIADRVAFVQEYLSSEDVRRRTRRGITILRTSLIGVIGGFLLVAASQAPAEVASIPDTWRTLRDPQQRMLIALNGAVQRGTPAARAAGFLEAARQAQRLDHHDAALQWLREAAALLPDDSTVLSRYADALEAAGRPLGARWARANAGE